MTTSEPRACRKAADDAEYRGRDVREEERRPFDTSELESIGMPDEDDPPYRDWWVISGTQG